MKRLAVALLLYLGLSAFAAEKDPLDYPLRYYGFILAVALLGGIVSFYTKVRSGHAQAFNIMNLIGELATSALSGLIVFWLCEAYDTPKLITAALVAMAGHAGARAITFLEQVLTKRLGVSAPEQPQEPKQ